jgi:predicted acylesterase/phospholipase RssA
MQNKPPTGPTKPPATSPTPTTTAPSASTRSEPPAATESPVRPSLRQRHCRVHAYSGAETAVVITGAVAQGAFAAGALEVLARERIEFGRVVATSAGALTGTLLAAGVYAGRVDEAAGALVDLWTHEAHWRNALDLSLRDVLRGRGVSTSRSLHRVLRNAVESMAPRGRHPISLQLIATALQGNPRVAHIEGRTSAEVVFGFGATDFETRDRRERIYTAATASAAFPGLYAPVHVPGVGDCIDGGIVNNAPIKRALDGGIERVIVIANTPRLTRTPPLAGRELAEHVVGTVIHERLYRDLREAVTTNNQLAVLGSLVQCGDLNSAQLDAVLDALNWRERRILRLVEIRPRSPLRGGLFKALSDRRLREEYIDEGRRAAEEALASPASVDWFDTSGADDLRNAIVPGAWS